MTHKLVYQSLGDQAVGAIADYILDQRLEPGAQLPGEETLAERFGVSRPVIREALKTLSGMGVVEIAKGKSPVVLPITSKPLLVYFNRAVRMERRTIIELVEVRRGIEVEAAGIAADRRSDADLGELDAALAAMRGSLGDADHYANQDVRFHVAIAAATGNQMFRHLVESIREALRTTISEGLRRRVSLAQLERVQEIHEQLRHEIATGSPDDARRTMNVHFDEAVLAIARDDGRPSPGNGRGSPGQDDGE